MSLKTTSNTKWLFKSGAVPLYHSSDFPAKGQSHVPILSYGSTGFADVPQLFCNESVLYVLFAVSNTSLSTVPFMNDFFGYH